MLQYIPIIITALLGLLGLISKTKKDDKPGYFNKLTPFGIIVCFLLLSSFITAIWLQNNKDRENEAQKKEAKNKALLDAINQKHQFEIDSIGREGTINRLENQKDLIEQQKLDDSARFKVTLSHLQNQNNLTLQQKFADSIRFNVTLSNFGEQLIRQDQTLFNIQKVIHPIKNVGFSYTIEISEGKSLRYKKYLERVKSGIDSLVSILNTTNTSTNGVSIAGWTDNVANNFYIKRTSSLYPNSSGEEEEIYFLSDWKPTLYFYKNPVDIKQTQFYFQTFKVGAGVNIDELAKLDYPDIQKTYYHKDGKDNQLVYDRWKNALTITSGSLQTDSNDEPTGKITSIPDLAKAKVFIQFPGIDSTALLLPQILSLEVGELSFNLDPAAIKIYKHNNQVYFEYNFENIINKILSRWQEK